MCLVAFAYRYTSHVPLVLISNRDEQRSRATAPAHVWGDLPSIYGGRDLVSGGSWLAVSTLDPRRLACVTNVRNPSSIREASERTLKSRGLLISDFIRSDISSANFSSAVNLEEYGACNLLLSDGDELWYASNYSAEGMRQSVRLKLSPGVYGLSNAHLDTPWPKTTATREAFRRGLDNRDHGPHLDKELERALYSMISDPRRYPDDKLPSTGVPLELERRLSASLIRGDGYGTRSQALVYMSDTETHFIERLLDAHGEVTQQSRVML